PWRPGARAFRRGLPFSVHANPLCLFFALALPSLFGKVLAIGRGSCDALRRALKGASRLSGKHPCRRCPGSPDRVAGTYAIDKATQKRSSSLDYRRKERGSPNHSTIGFRASRACCQTLPPWATGQFARWPSMAFGGRMEGSSGCRNVPVIHTIS